MKLILRLVATVIMLCQTIHVLANETMVKMETLEIAELATGRPMKINLWFPQGTCANSSDRKWCLADSAITDKAIIFSHGAMGSAIEYSWIGESLAAQGYVVVGVNHFGESWVYGQDKINPRSSGFIWQRAQDISALLDYLKQQQIFQKPVNWSNIIAMGHSAGGQTASMLAGATFELAQVTEYCKSPASNNDRSCNYAKNSEQAPEQYKVLFRESQLDPRVKTMILIDPALGAGAQLESLQKIKIPSLVIGAANNDFLSWANQGQRYAENIPNAHITLLNGQEGHFVFLNACTNSIKVMDVALCEDRAGVDRNVVHARLAQDILEFIHTNDAAFVARTKEPTAKEYKRSASILDILMYTPRWVFGLLAMLVMFGLMQARTRAVKIQVALIIPVVMLVLSLTGVLHYLGWQLPVLTCWLAGIILSTWLCLKLIGKNSARFNVENRKLIIQGSWLPLIVILGIFITRYALGVVTAMQLSIVHATYFPFVVSLILGAWSGFFLARGLAFWQVKQTTHES